MSSALGPTTPAAAALRVEGLRVELEQGGKDIVSDIDFTVAAGEIIGIVGESGSGKTTIAAALLGHVRAGARVVRGRVLLNESLDVLSLSRAELGSVRGCQVSYVSQDPATALNPVLLLGQQLSEVLLVHKPTLTAAGRKTQVAAALSEVGLPVSDEFLARFPHQLSGGQQQRILLALAFLPNPRLIVLDEPTTALDVTTQAKVLQALQKRCRERGTSAVYVSHDLSIVRNLVDRVIVLYAGRIVESARCNELFSAPAHPYTRALLDAIPNVPARDLRAIQGEPAAPGARPAGCAFAPRCRRASADCSSASLVLRRLSASHQVACLQPLTRADSSVPASTNWGDETTPPAPLPLLVVRGVQARYGARQVLFDVNFQINSGECLALVGESGSGKSTLARTLAGLSEQACGEITFRGAALPLSAAARRPDTRRGIQYVFQNPFRALNPTKAVGQILLDAVHHFFDVTASDAERRVLDTLERVALRREFITCYPRELSGGERQRIAIARALVCEPQLLICDEVTSSLDVSVQATILKLLRGLQDDGLSLLFVTHDLGVVRSIADRVIVLHRGSMVENGSVQNVLLRPSDPYTRELVRHSPSVSPSIEQN